MKKVFILWVVILVLAVGCGEKIPIEKQEKKIKVNHEALEAVKVFHFEKFTEKAWDVMTERYKEEFAGNSLEQWLRMRERMANLEGKKLKHYEIVQYVISNEELLFTTDDDFYNYTNAYKVIKENGKWLVDDTRGADIDDIDLSKYSSIVAGSK